MRVVLTALLAALAGLLPNHSAEAQVSSKSTTHATIRCESFGRESTCPIDTTRGVRLTREFSRNRCIQNRTWGYDSFRIWVRDGCQAEFEIGSSWQGGGPGDSEIVCESRSNRETRCDADTRAGVELIQQLSNAPCIRDRSWGYDRRAIWVNDGCRARFRLEGGGSGWTGGGGWGGSSPGNDPSGSTRITCESRSDRREHCKFPFTARDVQLVQNFGRSECRQGRNWNWGEGGVWVENFCAGEFLVFPARGGSGGWGSSGGTQRITCESVRDRQQNCTVRGTIGGARLVRQLSNSPCIEGSTWGWNEELLWVAEGCRAEFDVFSR